MSNNGSIIEARKPVMGKTWLVLQLMQGATLETIHAPRSHYAMVHGKAVTDIHGSEASLVGEIIDLHNFSFRDVRCVSSAEDQQGVLKTEWKWRST